jgi:hypothetical protein
MVSSLLSPKKDSLKPKNKKDITKIKNGKKKQNYFFECLYK